MSLRRTPRYVTIANGSKKQTTGIGQTSPVPSLSLNSVLHVHGWPFNLISVSLLTCYLTCQGIFTLNYSSETIYLTKVLTGRICCRFIEPLKIRNYPNSMQSLVGNRLPKFSTYQINRVKGSFDFIGLNYYTANYATDAPELSEVRPSMLTDPLVTK